MCNSDDSNGQDVEMPLPNHQHCGICRCNYEDFK